MQDHPLNILEEMQSCIKGTKTLKFLELHTYVLLCADKLD